MNFREALCFWMASHGMQAEECDKVCEDPRVALSIRLNDAGGALTDLRSALWRVHSEDAQRARRSLDDAGEAFMLLQHLRDHAGQSQGKAKAAKPAKLAKAFVLKLLAVGRRNQEDDWFVLLGNQRRCLSPEQLKALAARGTVQQACCWLPEGSSFRTELVSASMPAVFERLCSTLGLRMKDPSTLEARQVDRYPGSDDKVNCLEIDLELSGQDYLAFFERTCAAPA